MRADRLTTVARKDHGAAYDRSQALAHAKLASAVLTTGDLARTARTAPLPELRNALIGSSRSSSPIRPTTTAVASTRRAWGYPCRVRHETPWSTPLSDEPGGDSAGHRDRRSSTPDR
ncbi:MAG: hypothetical protein ABWY11_14365 [Umezawaea sp.]